MSSLSFDAETTRLSNQYFQIELTNHCNLSCTTCIRTVSGIDLQEQSFKLLTRQANWHTFWGGMRLQLPAFQANVTPICDKNPLAGCFIAADGSVAPCGMDDLAKLDRARNRFRKAFLSMPAPDCCKNCPKMEGF